MKKAAEKTAGIDMSGFQVKKKLFDGQTPPSRESEPPARRYTGVGSVMAAITREAEVSHELTGARAELEAARASLAEFAGATLVRLLDTVQIRRSRWANRSEAEFQTREFSALKEEIAHAGGNVQPIKVRVIDGQTVPYEIVYGHRRYQACVELGLPVAAVVAESMSDAELFAAMDRENRARKNLSAWEQGRMYEDALKSGLYSSVRRLSEALGVNLSDASRAIQLAKLPKEIVAAFASPLDLQVRWAKPLADALQRDPEGVLARARLLAKGRGARTPSQVLDQLVTRETRATPLVPLPIHARERQVGELTRGHEGGVTIQLRPGILEEQQGPSLVALIAKFLETTQG